MKGNRTIVFFDDEEITESRKLSFYIYTAHKFPAADARFIVSQYSSPVISFCRYLDVVHHCRCMCRLMCGDLCMDPYPSFHIRRHTSPRR